MHGFDADKHPGFVMVDVGCSQHGQHLGNWILKNEIQFVLANGQVLAKMLATLFATTKMLNVKDMH